MINYFAYGSNISEKRMKERNINFISRKFAVLKDYKVVFNKVSKKSVYIGYANIVESKSDYVEGALYEITPEELSIINKYEGANSKPSHYYRTIVDVICDGEIINAVTYVANPIMIRENIKPEKNYLNYILEGKDIFSEKYYEKLNSVITID